MKDPAFVLLDPRNEARSAVAEQDENYEHSALRGFFEGAHEMERFSGTVSSLFVPLVGNATGLMEAVPFKTVDLESHEEYQARLKADYLTGGPVGKCFIHGQAEPDYFETTKPAPMPELVKHLYGKPLSKQVRTDMTMSSFRQYEARALPLAKRKGQLFDLTHASLGMTTESGEVADQLKRHMAYDTPLDLTNIVEEVGDILWYLALACAAVGSSLEEAATMNIAKLSKRYPNGFSQDAAVNRDTSAERVVMDGFNFQVSDTDGH